MHLAHRPSLRPALVRLAALSLITLAVPAGRAAAQAASPSDSAANAVNVFNVATLAGDSVAPRADVPAEAVPRTGAPLTGLRSAVHTKETARALRPNAAATGANLGQARAMMIVGAAALITGAIIGEDAGTVIMVGGAVIGLYGLYQYLQ